MICELAPAEQIAALQLIGTLAGGIFAIYLLLRTLKEKRLMYRLSIYDKVYGNPDILKILYTVDKYKIIESLEIKVDSILSTPDNQRIYVTVDLEKETDVTLKYFDFVGYLLRQGDIKIADLYAFEYELKAFFKHRSILKYLNYLKVEHGMRFEGLDYLLRKLILDGD